jgi:DNA polymerase mu
VGVEYIWDTFQRCLESASQSDEGVPPKLPPRDQYYVQAQPPDFRKRRNSASDEESPNPKKRRINGDGEGMVGRKMIDYLPDIEMYDEDIKLKDIPRLCVERPSPLVCVNQDIVSSFGPRILDFSHGMLRSRLSSRSTRIESSRRESRKTRMC